MRGVRRATVALLVLAACSTALAAAVAWHGDSAPSVRGPVPLTPLWSGTRAAEPPDGLEREFLRGSYRELAAFRSRRETVVRVFTAFLRKNRAHCVGLRSEDSVGMSCAPSRFPNGSVVRVSQTGFLGETFVSGIVAPAVARFVATDDHGRSTEVEVTSEAFVFEGRWRSISIAEAVDADGRPLDR